MSFTRLEKDIVSSGVLRLCSSGQCTEGEIARCSGDVGVLGGGELFTVQAVKRGTELEEIAVLHASDVLTKPEPSRHRTLSF